MAHSVPNKASGLDNVVFTGCGIIRRTCECDDLSMADPVDQDRGTDFGIRAHGPIGSFFACQLSCCPMRLEEFAHGYGACWRIHQRRTLHEKRPVRLEVR